MMIEWLREQGLLPGTESDMSNVYFLLIPLNLPLFCVRCNAVRFITDLLLDAQVHSERR
jgi:hypothetical protein